MLVLLLLLFISCGHALQLGSLGSEAQSLDEDPIPLGENWDWEKNPNPSFLKPEMTGAPPKGAKIAIAFRGEYLRTDNEMRGRNQGLCSDYWMSKDNLDEYLIAPLRKAGAQVKLHFHTYSYCPKTDRELIADLEPFQYKLEADRWSNYGVEQWGQVYSIFEAMRLVEEDDWADYLVMVRFDVSFRAKITSLNVKWDLFNIGWRGVHFEDMDLVGDLFFAMPMKYFNYFAASLKVTCGKPPELGLPTMMQTLGQSNHTQSGNNCRHGAQPDGVYHPLVELIGVKEINFMDEGFYASSRSASFMYINRQCGSHLFQC